MITLSVLAGLFIVLFAGAFSSKRRFGLLGLALTAGATLSGMWADTAGLVVASTGVVPDTYLTQTITLSAIVLLPAILLLFHGYTYKNVIARIVGSVFFALLALAFLADPIGHILVLQGVGATVYAQLESHKNLIISIGIIVAVADLFFTKPAHVSEKEHKKH